MVSDRKVVFWVLPEDFFCFLERAFVFCFGSPNTNKVMEKLVFHQTISFHLLFFSCGLTCLEIKNNLFPQQQNALGSSAIVKVSEQTGAAPKPIPPRFPGSK